MKKDLKILSVDLDGTLIKSDLLYESFWSAFANDILIPFKALFALIKGKAFLKEMLFYSSSIDIKSLPYNHAVIEYINLHRSNGGKVALVTASNEKLAKIISKHLNLFDEVHGSSSIINLKGLAKAKLQEQKFGEGNFDYIGNSMEDLQSWGISNKAITFNASKLVKRKCELCNRNTLHLLEKGDYSFLASFIKEIRPYQWVKNILVFIPLIAAQKFNFTLIFQALLAFIAFSSTASSVYIFNDLLDIKADRNHPKKCRRPLAAGDLSLSLGSILGVFLLLVGSTFGFIIGGWFPIFLLIYYSITVFYSIYFKRKALLDIFVLSVLYTIRLVSGGIANNLEISFWLFAFSTFIFLSLASLKRQSELIDLIKRGKNKIENRGYKKSDLYFIRAFAICSGMISSLVLALYINSPKVLDTYSNPQFLWISCCLFLFWIIRVCFKTERGEMEHDPIIFALKDRTSRLIFGIIVLLTIFSKI